MEHLPVRQRLYPNRPDLNGASPGRVSAAAWQNSQEKLRPVFVGVMLGRLHSAVKLLTDSGRDDRVVAGDLRQAMQTH